MFVILQEGPDSFCVNGLDSRTNNLVESHNARLAKLMKSKPKFFNFVVQLATEEQRKAVQFKQLLQQRVGVFDEPDARYVRRTEAIVKVQHLLHTQKVTVSGFLTMLTNTNNSKLAVDLASFHEVVASDMEETADAEEYQTQQETCVLCMAVKRQVMLLPCSHMVICNNCYNRAMICPQCQTPSTGHIVYI